MNSEMKSKTSLLDVNVLIALFDPMHIFHEAAHVWFKRRGGARWATCPITENGFVRVVSNSRYPSGALTPAEAIMRLTGFQSEAAGHIFWSDEISLSDDSLFNADLIVQSKELTDVYLVGLAAKRGGRLASFDRRLRADAVRGVNRDLIELIDTIA
jgi:hypothetical protein